MGQKLSSLLLALVIYTALVFTAVYSYVHYRSSLLLAEKKEPKSIALTLAGSKHRQKISSPGKHEPPSVQKQREEAKTTTVSQKNKERQKTAERQKNSPPEKESHAPPATTELPAAVSLISDQVPKPKQQKIPQHNTPAPAPPSRVRPVPSIPAASPVDPQTVLSLKQAVSPLKKQKKYLKKPHKKRKGQHLRRSRTAGKKGTRGSNLRRSGSIGKSRFLARLKARINRNKSYPRVAERGGITGTVRVSFTILRSGGVSAISVGGPRVFHRSAKNAVRRAFPINPAKAGHSLPWRLTVSLRYRLR